MANRDDTKVLADMIYGEVASEDYDTMRMVGSTALNRLSAKKAKEFGSTLAEVLNKGYYAVSKNSDLYKQAVTGKFPDTVSEDAYKQAYAVAGALLNNTIEPVKGMFYFTPKEVTRQKKVGFKFDAVKDTGKVGKYQTYSY